ncbi:MAG: RagB/SusD family nutrient uptake outer membrane protein [Saprospiraceae bacterium]|nr:RagB/SusD family nutrient uptake outer membrane protein [Saprospiraceae bacterium]
MNRYIKISVFVLLTTCLMQSCSKDFLEKNPIIGVTQENFYKTADDAIAGVNAAYATLQFQLSPGGHFRWFWGDIMSDDAIKGGSGDNDVNDLLKLETFQGPVNTTLLEGEWSANYEGIYRANVVLEKVPGIDMDGKLKARILGEAKFIRAWNYYNLVTIFGGVPLADKVLAPSEYNIPRATAEQIWDFIEKDLKEASADLWKKSDYDPKDLGRITKGSAQALLAKTYLWRKKWAEAKAVTETIISSNEYTLVPKYEDIFTLDGENNAESIFEIQYMNASGGNWGRNNANEGTFTNVFTRARGQFGGFGFNIPTQNFVDEFFKEGFEDPRLKSTVFRVGDAMGDRGIFTIEATGGLPYLYYSKNISITKVKKHLFGDPAPNGGSNDRVLRYADVLLMHAESSFQAGDQNAARNSLNKVRARVSIPAISSSGNDLLGAIYRERRLELGLESHRFFDLVRTGQAPAVLGSLGFKAGTNELFPIPQSQILSTNGALTQNPGYN